MSKQTVTITRDQLKKVIVEVTSAEAKSDAASVGDPIMGMMSMMIGIKLGSEIEKKLFDESEDENNGIED